MILIRKAIISDSQQIASFQLNMAMETEDLSLIPAVVSKGVDAVFHDNTQGNYYVAEIDGKVVASLMTTYEWSD